MSHKVYAVKSHRVVTTPTDPDTNFVKTYFKSDDKLYKKILGVETEIGGGLTNISYDAIVDAAGGADYTLVSAALAGGARRIFVRNGTYIENTGLSYTGSDEVVIHGESSEGVRIVKNDTTPTSAPWMNFPIVGYFELRSVELYAEHIADVFFNFGTGNAVIENSNLFVASDSTATHSTDVLVKSAGENNVFFNKCEIDTEASGAAALVYVENNVSGFTIKFDSCSLKGLDGVIGGHIVGCDISISAHLGFIHTTLIGCRFNNTPELVGKDGTTASDSIIKLVDGCEKMEVVATVVPIILIIYNASNRWINCISPNLTIKAFNNCTSFIVDGAASVELIGQIAGSFVDTSGGLTIEGSAAGSSFETTTNILLSNDAAISGCSFPNSTPINAQTHTIVLVGNLRVGAVTNPSGLSVIANNS